MAIEAVVTKIHITNKRAIIAYTIKGRIYSMMNKTILID